MIGLMAAAALLETWTDYTPEGAVLNGIRWGDPPQEITIQYLEEGGVWIQVRGSGGREATVEMTEDVTRWLVARLEEEVSDD